jgi:glycosyltransferase involved in cell wall biosynthesis
MIKILKPRTPVVATFHTQCYLHQKWGGLAQRYLKFGEVSCCKLADRVIAVSENLKAYVSRVYGRNVDHAPNGISAGKTLRQAREISKWGLEKDNYIVAISRLVRHKGLQYLIEAYKKLDTDKKLVIVGGSSNTDSYVEELKEMAQGDPDIIFTGNQSGIILEELFSNAYLFVQPSESEGLSVALLEAMAYGLPVLTSDIPENREVVKESGFSFKNKSSRDLAGKLAYLLDNPALVKNKGVSAKLRVEENYNWDNIVKDTINIYSQAIFSKKPIKVKFIKYRFRVEVK